MGNCLLTKLKASVNNDNLPIYGKIICAYSGSATVTAFFGITSNVANAYQASGSPSVVKVDNDAYWTIYNQSTSLGDTITLNPTAASTQYDLHLPNGGCNIYYDRETIPFVVGVPLPPYNDFELLTNIVSMSSLVSNNVTLDVQKLPISLVKIQCAYLTNIDLLSKMTALKELVLKAENLAYIPTNDISGLTKLNINSISGPLNKLLPLENLTELRLFGGFESTGNFDSLFDSWAEAGKTGNMTFAFNNSALATSQELKAIANTVNHTISFSSGSWSIVS